MLLDVTADVKQPKKLQDLQNSGTVRTDWNLAESAAGQWVIEMAESTSKTGRCAALAVMQDSGTPRIGPRHTRQT